MDKDRRAEFYAHFGQVLSYYTSMVILSVTGESAETRTEATKEAQAAIDHMADDVAFLLQNMGTPPMSDEEDEDFKMWTNELKQN